MSADNFYLVRRHPQGGFVALMGFASDDQMPSVRPGDRSFETIGDAAHSVAGEWSEYGTQIHEECFEPVL